jgi:hypothetical protein
MAALLDGILDEILDNFTDQEAKFAHFSPPFAKVQTRMDAGFSPDSPNSPGGDSETLSPLGFAPLTDHELARLIVQTATAHSLDPMALWTWLDLDSIEALRSGSPTDIRALRAMVSLPTWYPTPPPEPHGLPFPGGNHRQSVVGEALSSLFERPPRCADCRHAQVADHPALVRCSRNVHAPGCSGLWWASDRHECGRFKPRGEALAEGGGA